MEGGAAMGRRSLDLFKSYEPERVITFCPTCQMQYTEYINLYTGPEEKALPPLDVPQAVDVVSISSVAKKGLMEMKECFWRLVAGTSEFPTKETLPLP
ncbi:MAG: hypothetical protein IH921_14540 [Gemmatimonadetes bacterium]|nr:hypothetical protein [Gemmatimonadota bacterium]